MTSEGEPLYSPQRLNLSKGEVLCKPARYRNAIQHFGGFAICKFRTVGNIGGTCNVWLVAGNQYTIFGDNQIRLDEVSTALDRQLVGRQRMFGAIATCPSMPNHNGSLPVKGIEFRRIRRRNRSL